MHCLPHPLNAHHPPTFIKQHQEKGHNLGKSAKIKTQAAQRSDFHMKSGARTVKNECENAPYNLLETKVRPETFC